MNRVEELALEIRAKAVARTKMFNLEGLTMIVCPTEDLYQASMSEARRQIRSKNAHPPRAPLAPITRRKRRVVTIDEILAGF